MSRTDRSRGAAGLATPLLLGLALAGCSTAVGGTGVAAPGARIAPPSTVIEDRVVPTGGADADYEPPTDCLMTVEDVSSVLEGDWSREELGEGNCVYTSDRGAILAIGPLQYTRDELETGLADARIHNCDTDPIDVPGTGGGFVCIEQVRGADHVEGNIVVDDHYWLMVIVADSTDPDHTVETDAMVALLDAAPH